MKFKNLIYIGTIAITILLNIVIVKVSILNTQKDNYSKNLVFNDGHYYVEDISFDPELEVINISKDTLKLYQILGYPMKLVINYDQMDCNTCFETINSALLQNFRDFGYHNILLIGSFHNYRSFVAFYENYGGFYEMYYLVPHSSSSEKSSFKFYNNVYLFCADNSFEQEMVYIPYASEEDKHRIESFLSIIINRFFK